MKWNKRAITRTLAALFCFCLWAPQVLADVNPQAAVKTATDQVLQLLREYRENTQARRQKIRSVVDEYFDFDAIAKRALGPRWKEQPPDKQQEFTRDFSQLLFNTYIAKVEKYANEKITYTQKQMSGDYAVVEVLVAGGQSERVAIDYYLRLKEGNWKVYDVVVEGVGLVTNYRSQFEEILSKSSFDDLLAQLKQKVAQTSQG
ncbi:MAG TPA: ABC transporter substrate-binding protein [Syntrophobacteraceae bacterium]|nr:ABC transporter substrate-binding protein [Syntrophobacteraceae bacterium]